MAELGRARPPVTNGANANPLGSVSAVKLEQLSWLPRLAYFEMAFTDDPPCQAVRLPLAWPCFSVPRLTLDRTFPGSVRNPVSIHSPSHNPHARPQTPPKRIVCYAARLEADTIVCARRTCLMNKDYQESRCQDVIDNIYKCCARLAPGDKSTACPKPEVVQKKLREMERRKSGGKK